MPNSRGIGINPLRSKTTPRASGKYPPNITGSSSVTGKGINIHIGAVDIRHDEAIALAALTEVVYHTNGISFWVNGLVGGKAGDQVLEGGSGAFGDACH